MDIIGGLLAVSVALIFLGFIGAFVTGGHILGRPERGIPNRYKVSICISVIAILVGSFMGGGLS